MGLNIFGLLLHFSYLFFRYPVIANKTWGNKGPNLATANECSAELKNGANKPFFTLPFDYCLYSSQASKQVDVPDGGLGVSNKAAGAKPGFEVHAGRREEEFVRVRRKQLLIQ